MKTVLSGPFSSPKKYFVASWRREKRNCARIKDHGGILSQRPHPHPPTQDMPLSPIQDSKPSLREAQGERRQGKEKETIFLSSNFREQRMWPKFQIKGAGGIAFLVATLRVLGL